MSEAKIIVRSNGSLKIEGDIPLYDDTGRRLETPEGRPYSLCRCGQSRNKPFCDGRHKEIEFDGTLAAR